MKIVIDRRKPRNPFAMAARFRKAGAHRSRDSRARGQHALREELTRMEGKSP